jgi:hypothetical protein
VIVLSNSTQGKTMITGLPILILILIPGRMRTIFMRLALLTLFAIGSLPVREVRQLRRHHRALAFVQVPPVQIARDDIPPAME